MSRKYPLIAGTSLMTVLCCEAGSAQNKAAPDPVASAPAASTPQESGLADIIVTAQRRRSDAQRTPIAMNVVSGERLKAANITDMKAMTAVAPELQVGSNATSTTFTIRGISSQDVTEIGDSAVSLNYDGEFVNRPLALNASLYDIERIEVLRGPQGTLYGRNATGGAINILTNRPTFDPGASVGVTIGNYNDIQTRGMVNVPVSETLAVRASFLTIDRDGYRNNGSNGGRGDDAQTRAGRVRVLYKPDSRFSALLTGEIIHSGGVGPVAKFIPVTLPATSVPDTIVPVIGSSTNYPLPVRGFTHTNQYDVRGELNYDFGGAKLTYQGGYRDTSLRTFYSVTGSAADTNGYNRDDSYHTSGHDLRLSGREDAPFFWQVGGYYSLEKQSILAGLYLGQHAYANSPPTELNYGGRISSTVYDYPDVRNETKAIYAQGQYHLLETLKLTGGIRYTHDNKSREGSIFGLDVTALNTNPAHPINFLFRQSGAAKLSSTRVNWLAGADWQVAPRSLIYVKASTGYKAGGFTTVNVYGPENITSYEAGTKNRFLDNKLQLNASIFYNDYKDLQVSTFVGVLGQPGSGVQTLNAGRAIGKGAEFETVWQPTPEDNLRVSFNYLDSYYKRFMGVVTAVSGASVVRDLSGNRTVFSPRVTIGAGYFHDFAFRAGKLTPSVNTRYSSTYYTGPENYAAARQKGFTATDLGLQYAPDGANWNVRAFVKNLEDKTVQTYSRFILGGFSYQFAPPRTFGGSFDITF